MRQQTRVVAVAQCEVFETKQTRSDACSVCYWGAARTIVDTVHHR